MLQSQSFLSVIQLQSIMGHKPVTTDDNMKDCQQSVDVSLNVKNDQLDCSDLIVLPVCRDEVLFTGF